MKTLFSYFVPINVKKPENDVTSTQTNEVIMEDWIVIEAEEKASPQTTNTCKEVETNETPPVAPARKARKQLRRLELAGRRKSRDAKRSPVP